jgi:D-3-phosphoglycerate dehydrogenase/(S)-sulfolactate dehydrogenase
VSPPGVVLTEDIAGEPLDALARELPLRREPDAWRDDARLRAALAGAAAVVVRNRTPVDRALLEDCPELRIVARVGVGLDNIDVVAADDLGVVVSAPLGANAVSVAEHALGLALALARRVVPLDRDCRAGGWSRTPGRELAGRTWGLLGAGATGRACARLARGLGMTVIAHDPHLSPAHPELAELGIRLLGLDEVAAGSDVLSCHLPSTPETRGLIDAAFLARMRPDAVLISVGRGDVVDEEALAGALEAGRLGGAGLDVRGAEPPSPGRLERLDSVVLTPHVAGITAESQRRILEVLAGDIRAVCGGGEARHAVGRHATPRDRSHV